MRRLDPEQSAFINRLIHEYWPDEEGTDIKMDFEALGALYDRLGNLKTVPGQREHCGGCQFWGTSGGGKFACVYKAHKALEEGSISLVFWRLIAEAHEGPPPERCPDRRWEASVQEVRRRDDEADSRVP